MYYFSIFLLPPSSSPPPFPLSHLLNSEIGNWSGDEEASLDKKQELMRELNAMHARSNKFFQSSSELDLEKSIKHLHAEAEDMSQVEIQNTTLDRILHLH
ncbi:hypothetical protein L6164_031833 [Bauhinia variegata]|uniref:Uncharacterized protein n=1 Tax=Bauhinia variegata TaxID=167791 RepID=A0ACB9KLV8_BAUVA|nr:hypothetical protein L6164_031833 [Bauhinia variegata]